jgi:antitoxin Phd
MGSAGEIPAQAKAWTATRPASEQSKGGGQECPPYTSVVRLTIMSILSIMDIMRTVSATDAKQRLAALLDAAQREPVVIRRQNRDVAVIMSAEEYERMRDLNAAEFQRFCDRVAAQAKARGLTESALKKLLKD